ncbi:MAG: outer membrane beta-barrel family protein [Tannerellaceae bacterium]|jgi:hypothetical protein|nr:outer membrane beta-barrel family protein [Tannerellaceae bacterium]
MKLRLVLLPFILYLCCFTATAQLPVDTTLSLQNVVVQGTHFGGISGGELQHLTIENNLSSLTGATAEAIRQLPSLLTDIEGGITYRGSVKAGVVLNNVPYGLLEEYSGDVLIQLPALFFERITLTAFPPIGNIPDGDAGVLSLLPAVSSSSESPLQVVLGAGLQERYNAGVVAGFHPGKFHITAKYNYRREYRERSFQKTTTNNTGTTEMDNNASARPDVHLADLSVGYDLTPQDRIKAYGLYHRMAYDRYGGINNTRKNPAGEIVNKMLRHRFNRQQQDAYAAEAQWLHRPDNSQEQLEVLFNYNNFSYDENNDFKNERPETGAIIAQDQLFVDHTKNNYYFTVSYRKPFASDFLFNGGYTGRFRDESYTANAYDLKEDRWQPNETKSNTYSFERYTQMLFTSLEKHVNRFFTDIGLQVEYQTQKAEKNAQSNIRLYPRIKMAYQTKKTDELSIKYIQRVNRPYGIDLNPFTDRSDATYIKQGNPDLKNEYVHTLELTYQFSTPRLRVSPTLYYRNKQNRIMDMAIEQEGEMIWKKENIGKAQTTGFELSGNLNPVNPLTIGLSTNIYKDEIDGRQIGYNEKKSLICWDIKGNINLSITPSTMLQADGFYVSDQLTPQGKIKSHFSVNAGLSQHLLKQKLRINLSIQNTFDSLKETTIIDTEQTQMRQVRNRDARVTWLSLTYWL